MCDFQIIEISILSSPMPIMVLCPEIINIVAISVDTLCNAFIVRPIQFIHNLSLNVSTLF